jgi:chromosomal replication initiator protein
VGISFWKRCLDQLEGELSPQQFNTWIRPLHAIEDGDTIRLLAPNRFVLDWINERHLSQINNLLGNIINNQDYKLTIEIGSRPRDQQNKQETSLIPINEQTPRTIKYSSNLNKNFTLDTFVEGKSNQLARAASVQVGINPGAAYNPLFIYGGVGLGKTHLMNAIGHIIQQQKPNSNIAYLHSERFVADMVRALQHNAINEFKRFYRSLDALLIDDIQFFARKERSQEEFFHTFNALLEGQQALRSD